MGNNKTTYLIIYMALLFCMESCYSHNAENKKEVMISKNENSKEMEKNKDNIHGNLKKYIPIKELNIKEFDAKRKGSHCHFVDVNGMEVVQTVNAEFPSGEVIRYIEKRKFPGSAYMFYSEYNAKGILVKTLIAFHGTEVGFMRFYDTSGEIIKKEDLDISYKFSTDNLIEKMKAEYGIDIVDTKICYNVTRGIYKEHNNNPLYCVYINGDMVSGQFICYVIDGNTGETLFTTIRNRGEKKDSIADEYFNSLKKDEGVKNNNTKEPLLSHRLIPKF